MLIPGTYVLKICDTTEQIDIEKLKVHEKIHFFDDVQLFEDELADNGSSSLNVKMVSKFSRNCSF